MPSPSLPPPGVIDRLAQECPSIQPQTGWDREYARKERTAWGRFMWFDSGCEITSEVEGLRASVSIAGKMTIGSGDLQLRSTIRGLLDQGVRFIELDLADVSRIDNSGIGELVAACTDVTNRGGRLRLQSLPRKLQDILDSINRPNFPNFPDGFAY